MQNKLHINCFVPFLRMDNCPELHCAKKLKMTDCETPDIISDIRSLEKEDKGATNSLSKSGCGEEYSDRTTCREDTEKSKCTKNAESNSYNEDSNYFRCYADLSIHKVMIEDQVRTQTYRKAILSNYQLFYNKVVADVGAGTGILSIFCTQAGAQKVYAIEASSVAEEAKKVVECNGLSDKITVIHGKVEDVTLPEKVDIIVSEWMGYMLMYESMLPSVLHARDKWLKQGGLMFPEEVKLHIAPVSDYEDYDEWVEFCKDVKNDYKIDMSPLVQTAERQMQAAVRVLSVNPITVQAHGSCVASLHLPTVDASSVSCVEGSFSSSCFGYTNVNGFVIWFTAHFPEDIVLSTSPYEVITHWEQSVMYVTPATVHQDTVISGHLRIRNSELYHRFLSIELEYQVSDGEKMKTKYELRD